jgi:hypothetical protein
VERQRSTTGKKARPFHALLQCAQKRTAEPGFELTRARRQRQEYPRKQPEEKKVDGTEKKRERGGSKNEQTRMGDVLHRIGDHLQPMENTAASTNRTCMIEDSGSGIE